MSCALFSWLVTSANFAFGFSWVPTKSEWDTLPPYCKARIAVYPTTRYALFDAHVPPEEIERWRRQIGDLWSHLHHYCLGVALLAKGEWKGATGEITYTLFKADPKHPLAMKMSADLIRAYQGMGAREAATAQIGRIMSWHPDDPRVYTIASDFYQRDGHLAQAVEMLKLGQDHVKDKAELSYRIAKLYLQHGDYESAREYARTAEAQGASAKWLREQLANAGYPIAE